MERLSLKNFEIIPSLAKTFWHLSKHTYEKDIYNKKLSLKIKDISFICIFSGKYQKTTRLIEGNNMFNSKLIIEAKNYKIEENCYYFSYNESTDVEIKYLLKNWIQKSNFYSDDNKDRLIFSLKDKLELTFNLDSEEEISNNFHNCLPLKTQILLNDIKHKINTNKNFINEIN